MGGLISWVVGLSLAGGATCLVVYAASIPVRSRVRASWLYYLWLIVLLRFVIPVPLNLPAVTTDLNTVSTFIASAITRPNGTFDHGTFDQGEEDAALLTEPRLEPGFYDASQEPASIETDTGATDWGQSTPPAESVTDLNGMAKGGGASFLTAILKLLPAVWLAGAAVMLIWTITGYILTVGKLRHRRILLTPGRVPVYENSSITTPILTGLIYPVIYLPAGFLCPDMAIRHELCHLRRGDLWLKWVIRLTVCIHWFNPAVYLMQRELNRFAELACDNEAVEGLDQTGRISYAQMLLDTARAVTGKHSMMVAGLGRDKLMFKERMREVMEDRKLTKRAAAAMSALAACALSAAILCGVFLTGCTTTAEESADKAGTTEEPAGASDAAQPIEPANNADAAVNREKSDLPFIDDPNVLGTWSVLDIEIIETNDNSIMVGTGDYSKAQAEIVFAENGVTNVPDWTWSRGSIKSSYSGETLRYSIQDTNGSKTMYLQKPYADKFPYFLLIWSSASTEFNIRTDNIDLPFADDPAVIGTWECVDYVEKISDFNPEITSTKELFLTEMIFSENGALSPMSENGPLAAWCQWTKGVVIDPHMKTAGAYEIKEINGTAYLFFEWKNGDYSYRDMDPWYYVLAKQTD